LSPNWDKNFLLNPGFGFSIPLGSSFNFAASTVALLQYTLDQWLAAFTQMEEQLPLPLSHDKTLCWGKALSLGNLSTF
jgi:hypothetical protein